MSIGEIREYLNKSNIHPENVSFICGYFSDKPERWHKIFLMKASGNTQGEIAEETGTYQQHVSAILCSIERYIKNVCNYKS